MPLPALHDPFHSCMGWGGVVFWDINKTGNPLFWEDQVQKQKQKSPYFLLSYYSNLFFFSQMVIKFSQSIIDWLLIMKKKNDCKKKNNLIFFKMIQEFINNYCFMAPPLPPFLNCFLGTQFWLLPQTLHQEVRQPLFLEYWLSSSYNQYWSGRLVPKDTIVILFQKPNIIYSHLYIIAPFCRNSC